MWIRRGHSVIRSCDARRRRGTKRKAPNGTIRFITERSSPSTAYNTQHAIRNTQHAIRSLSQFLALCLLFHARDMKGSTVVRFYALALLLGLSGSFSSRAADNSASTNWVENTITNLIEVRMARNRLINEYRTNWVERVRTNVVDLYKTNWQNLSLTNELAVNRVHTNFVAAYTTNVQTLSLTNWEMVVVMKTNWVTQFVTNAVQLDIPKPISVSQRLTE